MREEADQELVDEIARGLVASTDSPATIDDVPGWFGRTDQDLFDWILGGQTMAPLQGNIVELGTFLGKSAIHIGKFAQHPTRFFVCDLFGSNPLDTMSPSARTFYSKPFRNKFERNYLHFHDELPSIIQAPASAILEHVPLGSCKFVHVDASHEYDNIKTDINSARQLLKPAGVAAFDDYRTEHTPGTAAAVWEAVANCGLRIICLSAYKLYGTWGDASLIQDELLRMLPQAEDYTFAIHSIMDQRVIRVVRKHRNSTASHFPA